MNLFEKFKNLTGISIKDFYTNLLDFYENYHTSILNYYTEYSYPYPGDAFFKYKNLCKDLDLILSKIVLYKGNFVTTDIWDLMDQLDDIKLKLNSIPAYPRIYQVGFYKKQINDSEEYQTYRLGPYETIESVSRDYKQNITDLVLINELNEENWTESGGKQIILKTNISNAVPNFVQEEVVFDVLLGKNLLGKDLPPYFLIDEDTEDLTVLTPEQTFLTAVEILCNLKMGEIPEYPEIGVDKSIYGECTKGNAGFTFPILLRQLNIALETDDTILSFSIDDIQYEEEKMAYTIYASVQNRLMDNLKFITSIE